MVFMGVSQITSSHVTEEPIDHKAVLQQDELQRATDAQKLDIEINRNAQTALNQTRQMIVADLTENVEALYQDATLAAAYHDAILAEIADAN